MQTTPTLEALQPNELTRLSECETVIERGKKTFVEVGTALAEIRDAKLYRLSHETFEDYCKERWGWQRQRAYELIEAAKVVSELPEECNQKITNENQAAALARVSPDERSRVLESAASRAEQEHRPITARDIAESARPHVSNNSGENEWYTPPQFIEAARKTMEAIDLDPASCALANENVQAKEFFAITDDGLTKEWHGRVWLNPPYSHPEIEEFTSKCSEEVAAGRVSEACVLVNNATETAWFQNALESAVGVCFPRGRIKYLDKTGKPANTPLQGQAILYFGKRVSRFAKHFRSEDRVGDFLDACWNAGIKNPVSFLESKRPQVYDWLKDCFPRGILPTDIDGEVEINGHFLRFEFKDESALRNGYVPKGQRKALEKLVLTKRFTVFIIGTNRIGEPTCIEMYGNFGHSKLKDASREKVREWCKEWAEKAEKHELSRPTK